jgi:hypothetical protein
MFSNLNLDNMTKRKTALQSAIDEIQDILNSRGANESNCDDVEFGLIQSVKILKSKLAREKQDLIQMFDDGYEAKQEDNTISSENYFNQTFEI